MAQRYPLERLAEAAGETSSAEEAVLWFGGEPTPARRSYLRSKMAGAGIDISHWTSGRVRHTEQRLREVVAASRSVKDVVRQLGISQVGGNQAHISRRITSLGIDTSHFARAPRTRSAAGRRDVLGWRDPDQGRAPGQALRRALLRSGVADRCALCGTGPEWNGRPLRLQVDHISGDWWDNRPDNLRLLCPNCHAVTDTYRGRRRRTP
ncbi:HNH endonuclease [Actinacidiphila rubida]|uniref:HNH endonuclease n=1 Tax=Actinacidiphila rubida TaxID=310780 RepID=A0A1H8HWP0_9ACTN|nr:HNH endonuclease [Actinacidiphila rubida]SEN60810.1 HNH endonuclease [Actinacidiphila rubida]